MAPQSIDRYKIIEELGRGGMATVFKAHDPLFEREVAIKVMPPELSRDQQFRARFIREARTIAALEHPSIVPVYDYGEDYSQPYLVMRYMTGGSLTDRLREKPLSLAETNKILGSIGAALDAAHQKGIIHRDLKPGNILFDQYGESYLADFGIVHLASSNEALTATGSLVGTPSYMSPEQVHGDKVLDGRSDIYALGVILFQMLTGDIPYTADTPAKAMMRHVLDPIPRVHESRPDLPEVFDTIIRKAMAKDPEDRFPSGNDLSIALNTAISQTGPSGSTPNDPQPIKTEILYTQQSPPDPQPEPDQTTAIDAALQAAPIKSGPIEIPVLTNNKPTPSSGGRRFSPIIWVGIGVLILICLGAVGAAGWVISNLPNEGSNVVVEGRPSVVTVEAIEVVDAAATGTAESLIATREQLALDAAVTETAVPPTTKPTVANDEARESALATRQALEEVVTSEAPVIDPLASLLKPIFGPNEGKLLHEDNSRIESIYADPSPADFIVYTTFDNPYSTSVNSWDFGVVFRQIGADDEMRLVVRSDGFWNLNDRLGTEDNFIHEGEVADFLHVGDGESNDLLVAALGEQGYFFLNGRYVFTLDLSSRTEAGDLAVSTGFYTDSEQFGEVTSFSDFTIWPGNTAFGPKSGGMEHIDDNFIKIYSTELTVRNFIAAAELGNPYATSEGPWDIGFSFRDVGTGNQFWLIIDSSGNWSFTDRQNEEDTILDEGVVKNLNVDDNGVNQLGLIALGDIGYFFLNEKLVSNLDLSSRMNAGDVSVATAYAVGNEIEGNTTTFTNFTVWPLP